MADLGYSGPWNRPRTADIVAGQKTCLLALLYDLVFGIFKGYRSSAHTKVIGSRSRSDEQRNVKCYPTTPGLSESMPATAVTASPFQSLLVRENQRQVELAGGRLAGHRGHRVQT